MTNNNTRADLRYLNGFGNEFQSESIPGALPLGRNSPQRPAHGLFVELISGTAFTAPRAENRRTWMYRTLPTTVAVRFTPYEQPLWTHVANDEAVAPDPMRWRPTEIPADTDFIDGLRAMAVNGDPDLQVGMAALIYVASKSMVDRVIVNTDAEMLLVPQLGSLLLTTELGLLEVRPGEVSIIPRGMAFSVGLPDGQSRGYVCENFGSHFRLPELGPIGSNGLANARDFQSPVAAYDSTADRNVEIIRKSGGRLWTAHQSHSPFNVVAWHGNLVPYKYDTARFMTIGTISYDHPDPSIFTVLTSPSDTAGVANCDFVIFPPRWLVAEDTFRPPWFHRNVMSEFMGLIHGRYDAKAEGFVPGAVSLHNCMVPHGPDAETFHRASAAGLKPEKLDGTLAFMFESRYRLKPTRYAMTGSERDEAYVECWGGFRPAGKEVEATHALGAKL